MLNGSFAELADFSDLSAPKKPDLCADGQLEPVQVHSHYYRHTHVLLYLCIRFSYFYP